MSFVPITNPTIFHSGVAADFYKYYMLRNASPVIRSSYFNTWDVFRQCKNPQILHGRYLFCQQFLQQHSFTFAETPFYNQEAYTQLESLLASLPKLATIYEQSKHHAIPAGLRKNITLLHKQYTHFLAQLGRQESAWTTPEIEAGTCLFLPELFSDQKWKHAENIDRFRIIHSSDLPKPASISYTQFPDAASEIDCCLASIEKLLDNEVDTEDIVITVASPEDYRDSLEASAEFYGVPISVHVGTVLSNYPAARLFEHLEHCRIDAFSVESLQELFLDPSLHWKSMDMLRTILNVGRRCNISKGVLDVEPKHWENCLQRYAPHAKSKFENLHVGSKQLYQAEDFETLRKEIHLVINRWFNDEQKEYHILGRVLRELDVLVALERELLDVQGAQKSKQAGDPWRHFIAWLRKNSYTQVYNTRSIAVYPYGVSAGIHPRYHFILGCSLSATQRREKLPSWINEPAQQRMQLDAYDQTEAFIQAYCHSGEHILCSFAESCFGNQHTPQHHIAADVQDAALSERVAETAQYDRRTQEPRLQTLSKLQHDALTHQLATGFRNNVRNYRNECIEDARLRTQLSGQLDSLSLHAIDQFLLCPFTFLMQNILRLRKEEDYESFLLKTIGTIYHDVLATLFAAQMGATITLPPSEELEEIVDTCTHKHRLYTYAVDLEVQKRKILHTIKKCIEELIEYFPEHRIFATEKTYELAHNDTSIVGKIDLVLIQHDTLSILDYKKSTLHTKAELYGEKRKTLQLPFYAYLLQASTHNSVSSAHYYSLEKAELKTVYGNDKRSILKHDEFKELVDSIPSIVTYIQERIQRGDYRCPDGCEHCSMPELSRSGYQVVL